jgi:hypothetical protein
MTHEMLRRFVSTGCEVHQAVISVVAKPDTSDKSARVFKANSPRHQAGSLAPAAPSTI